MPGPGMLTLMLLPAVIGLVIVARPSVAMSLTNLRGKWLIVLAAAMQYVQFEGCGLGQVSDALERRTVAVLVVAIAAGFCWLNRPLASSCSGRWALWLIPLGTASNSIPIAALGAMPYSVSSARIAGHTDATLAMDSPGYIRLGEVSQLWMPFSDFIPIPGLLKTLSIGDLLLIAGLVLLIVACARPSAPADSDTAEAPLEPSV